MPMLINRDDARGIAEDVNQLIAHRTTTDHPDVILDHVAATISDWDLQSFRGAYDNDADDSYHMI